jgi:hypothetical protein
MREILNRRMRRRSFLTAPLIAGLIWSPFGSAAHAAFGIFQTYSAAYDQIVNFSSYGGSPANSAAANTTAVSTFNTAYAAMSGRTLLVIDPGTYNFNAFNIANTLGIAGSRLTISAYGVTITAAVGTQGVAVGAGIVQGGDNAKETRINTVSAGASTVTLKTAGETSRFAVGGYACVGGVNMQGAGDPPNQAIFEYKKIQSIGVGTLTFTEPLEDSYQDTWPLYTLGRGGPATVFPMQGFWDQEVEFQGARFTDTGNLIYGKPRVMQWTDCTFDTYGPCPTVNNLFRALRCSADGTGGLEVDKCINRIEFIDCAIRAIDFQSASVNHLYVLNHTAPTVSGRIPRWNGGARKSNTFINLTIGAGGVFRFGPMNYGIMGPTTMTNCSSPSAEFFNQTTPFSSYTEAGGGVLSYSGGPGTAANPSHWWATPGGNAVLLDSSNNFARSFQISDVSQSGGDTIITTNLPFPVPASINGRSAPWKIIAHPCADLTMSSCTGNWLFTSQSALPAHTPFQDWTL